MTEENNTSDIFNKAMRRFVVENFFSERHDVAFTTLKEIKEKWRAKQWKTLTKEEHEELKKLHDPENCIGCDSIKYCKKNSIPYSLRYWDPTIIYPKET